MHTLSGGEAQRASLARAFATEPEVLLLDEPFAALDPPTRDALLDDLSGVLAAEGTSAVFVTHDREEALRLGDRVAVLLDGRLAQVGPAPTVFGAPADEAVARLVGVANLLDGRVTGEDGGLVEVRVPGGAVTAVGAFHPGERVLVALRPEDITLELDGAPRGSSARNCLPGTVRDLRPVGALIRVGLDCGVPLTAVVTRAGAEALGLAPSVRVLAAFKAAAVHLIRPRPGR